MQTGLYFRSETRQVTSVGSGEHHRDDSVLPDGDEGWERISDNPTMQLEAARDLLVDLGKIDPEEASDVYWFLAQPEDIEELPERAHTIEDMQKEARTGN